MSSFTFQSTADEVAAALGSEIKGKNVIITGASPKSLAFEAAAAIASQSPNLLVLTARNLSSLEQSKIEILAKSPEANIKLIAFDLGSQTSIRDAASKLLHDYSESFDIIINCAGAMALPYSLTEDGIEAHFAINYLGSFLLTNLLIPKLNRDARIVNVSSRAYQLGPILWDDINFLKTPYEKWLAYAQSKGANILFSAALARKAAAKGILSYSVHPGTILTNIGRHLVQEDYDMLATIPMEYKQPQQGAANMLIAAFDPTIKEYNGGHFDDDNIIKSIPEAFAYVVGSDNEDRLWELSESLVHQKFAY